MGALKSKKTKTNEKRREQIVKNWLSSFVVTSAVVVATVVMTPISPSATFLDLVSAGTNVYYSVEVVDEALTLEENSLSIVATSSLETRKTQLEVGQTEGVFEELLPNVEYVISVVGSTGFGEYALTSETIITTDDYGGEFVEANFIQTDGQQEMLECDVELIYSDYKNEIKELYVKYAYQIIEEGYYNYGFEELEYSEELVTENHFLFTIFYIPKIEGNLYLILEATLYDDSTVILDEEIVQSPIIIQAYAYIDNVAENSVTVVVYPDMSIENATYYVVISTADVIIEQKTIEFTYYEEYYSDIGYLTFENLVLNTEYILDFFVEYTDDSSGLQETQSFYAIPVVIYNQMPTR